MRFYADENIPLDTVIELRRLGHDVLTAYEDGRANNKVPDDEVLRRSTELGRILITINRQDFRRLHESGIVHSGIVICTLDLNFARQASGIETVCKNEETCEKELLRVHRPSI